MNVLDNNPKEKGGIEQFLKQNETNFPYKIILSMEKIIHSWEQKTKSENPFIRSKAGLMMEIIEQNPILKKPELSKEDVEGKEDIIKNLFSDAYPIDLDESQAFAVAAPFSNQFIYKSKRFKEAYNNAVFSNQAIELFKNNNPKLVNAFAFILKEIYNAEIGILDIPFVFPSFDPETGFNKYYKVHLACADYSTVIAKKKSKPFCEKHFDILIQYFDTPNQWLKYFPITDYVFKGVSLITLIDITDQETLSRIQNILFKNSTLSRDAFDTIGQFASDFLESPKTQVGVVAFDKSLHILKEEEKFGLSVLSNNGIHLDQNEVGKMVSEFESGTKLIFLDSHNKDSTFQKYHKKLKRKNILNLVLAPLYKENRMIGMLEITMQEDHIFSAFYVDKIYQLVPLFELALDRSIKTVNNKIQKIIKDNCTAIHPSVEWKFFTEAVKLYENLLNGQESEQMNDIIFENVMPIYGLSDIRNSSVQRGNSIKSDLIRQLTMAKKNHQQAE